MARSKITDHIKSTEAHGDFVKNAHTVDGVGFTGSSTQGLRKITTSTAEPSGGADGDIWIKYKA